jgi:hypothetical protein
MPFDQSFPCDDGDARDAHSCPFNLKKKKREGVYLPSRWQRARDGGWRWASPSSQASQRDSFVVVRYGLISMPRLIHIDTDLLLNSQEFQCPGVVGFRVSEYRGNGPKRHSDVCWALPQMFVVQSLSQGRNIRATVKSYAGFPPVFFCLQYQLCKGDI